MTPKETLDILTILRLRHTGRKNVTLTGDGPAIIGIPGWAGGFANWIPNSLITYAENRRLKGRLLSLGMQNESLSYYRSALSQAVAEFPNPYIVGISMGGLIALDWAIHENAFDLINHIVCIASPIGGIAMLKHFTWACRAFKDMAPRSQSLHQINASSWPSNKVTLVFGSGDLLAIKPGQIAQQARVETVEASSHNHLQYNIPALVGPILDEIIKPRLGNSGN